MKVYHGSHIRIDFFLQGKNISEVVATDLFYTSKTFAQLANESTGLHLNHGKKSMNYSSTNYNN